MLSYVEPNSEQWLDLQDLSYEEWKDIENFERLYQVSNYGRVKSLLKISELNGRRYETKIMKCHYNTKKYLDVELCKKGTSQRYRIHRLVAEAFIPNPENKPQVNHINGNKQDNRVENLEWCTNGENQIHAFNTGLNYRKKYGESPKAKQVVQYDLRGNIVRIWDCVIRIKHELGYSDGYICKCCKGKYKTAYGYVWKYKESQDGMEI